MIAVSPARVAQIEARRDEIQAAMARPDLAPEQFVQLSKDYAEIEPVAQAAGEVRRIRAEMAALEEMLGDPDMRAMAEEELVELRAALPAAERSLALKLLPRDAADERAAMLEIRAGTGGDEAALFAGDLFRMYNYYAQAHGWDVEIMSTSAGEHGGYKEIIARIAGQGVYARLKFESGVHRVQRVPATEAQGRIHTSTCTVAVLPEAEAVDAIALNPADLKTDTFRASGAGGQHVNKTDSAIRITHLPTGIVVECQDERSQHKNRARALSILSARILEMERRKQQAEEAATRKSQVGTGDRSERIRTFNFPQGRVTDHRVNLTLYKLDQVMEGKIDEFVDALTAADQADRMAALGN